MDIIAAERKREYHFARTLKLGVAWRMALIESARPTTIDCRWAASMNHSNAFWAFENRAALAPLGTRYEALSSLKLEVALGLIDGIDAL